MCVNGVIMFVSEKIAAHKWCPFSRIVVCEVGRDRNARVEKGSPTFNRVAPYDNSGGLLPPAAACVGRNCMAWQPHKDRAGYGQCGLTTMNGGKG